MQCADITAVNSSDGNWIIGKAIFNNSVKGTVTLVMSFVSNETKITDWEKTNYVYILFY